MADAHLHGVYSSRSFARRPALLRAARPPLSRLPLWQALLQLPARCRSTSSRHVCRRWSGAQMANIPTRASPTASQRRLRKRALSNSTLGFPHTVSGQPSSAQHHFPADADLDIVEGCCGPAMPSCHVHCCIFRHCIASESINSHSLVRGCCRIAPHVTFTIIFVSALPKLESRIGL